MTSSRCEHLYSLSIFHYDMKLAHEKCDNLIVVYFNKITEDTRLKQENITFQVGNNLEKVSD